MEKIYVVTKTKPFNEEIYDSIWSSIKKAEKHLRQEYPYMREIPSVMDNVKTYSIDTNNSYLLFIREEIVK